MKNLNNLKSVLLCLFCLVISPVLLANSLLQDEPATQAELVFYSFSSLVGIIPVVTEFFKVKFNLHGQGLQIFSWGIGLAISVAGYYINIGIFSGITIIQTLLFGLGASLAANGAFTIKQVKLGLEILFARFK